MNYDEAIQWLSEWAAESIELAGLLAREGMEHTEREAREEAAALITIENMLRYHARVSRD